MTARGRRASRPDERQCAMLIAHLLATKQEEASGREVTRARLSEITLQRLFCRRQITPQLLADVQEWLFRIGWVLFFAGNTYAIVKASVVEGWGRISSKKIGRDLEDIAGGEFDFDTLEHLLLRSAPFSEDAD